MHAYFFQITVITLINFIKYFNIYKKLENNI
jgi:hypothetical protein